jgi:opacity protein-like surface antigen
MIKKLCIAIIAMGIAGLVNAQEVKIGVKVGMNISSLNGNDNNLDAQDGWVLGGTAEIALTEKFSVQPEFLYSQQGAQDRENFLYDLKYMTMPIIAKY